jgi:hypothetical protein
MPAAIPRAEMPDLEEYDMHTAHRYIASLFLTAALVMPVAAAPAPQSAGVQLRVYDPGHKDYHNWDENENHAWGQYLMENNKKPHEFAKAKKSEKSQYWNWRHEIAKSEHRTWEQRSTFATALGDTDT